MWEDKSKIFWCAGDLGKNMQNLKGVIEQDPYRVWEDREWGETNTSSPGGTV